MRFGGSTLAAICGLLVAVPAGASASALKPGISPRAVAWFGAPPTCPAADIVDGRQAAQAARDLITGRTKLSDAWKDDDLLGDDPLPGEDADAWIRSFLSIFALANVVDEPSAVVTVCDPELARTGQPAGTVTGEARDAPESERIGAGLRSRGGTFGRATGAAAIGDRFVLPAVGAGSLIDVAVDTTTGAATTRVGPVGAVPTAVRIAGQLAAPQVVVEYADGSSSTHAVTPPPAVRTSVAAKTGKRALRLTVRTAPGAFVLTSASNPESSDSMDAFTDPSETQVAGGDGKVTTRLGDLDSSLRQAEITVIDAQRRAVDAWTCALKWSGRTLRGVRCAGGPDTSERPRIGAPTVGASGAAARAARAAMMAPSELPPPNLNSTGGETLAPSPAPAAAAHAARKPALAALGATAMFRARGADASDLIDTIDESSEPLFADVTGDGRPESSFGDGLLEPQRLLASSAAGWKPISLRSDALAGVELASAGDLNGDGVAELWAYDPGGRARAIAGSPAWSTTPPARLDVRDQGVGPRDLLWEGEALPETLPDVTGDGRPELAVTLNPSSRHAGVATFSSADAPLGQRLALPAPLLTDPAADVAYLAGAASQDLRGYDGSGGSILTADGRLFLQISVDPATGRARVVPARLSQDGRALAALPAFTAAGVPTLQGYDPASGDLLVRTSFEACQRRKGCVSRVLRVSPDGRTVASLSVRGDGSEITARFVPDGPDADTRAEVVVRDVSDLGERSTVPGFGGSIALWGSATGSPAWRTLPVAAVSGQALTAHGSLMGWTSSSGVHHAGTWVQRGSGRKRSLTLLDLGAPR